MSEEQKDINAQGSKANWNMRCTDLVTCPQCHGAGDLRIVGGPAVADRPVLVSCLHCSGTGKLNPWLARYPALEALAKLAEAAFPLYQEARAALNEIQMLRKKTADQEKQLAVEELNEVIRERNRLRVERAQIYNLYRELDDRQFNMTKLFGDWRKRIDNVSREYTVAVRSYMNVMENEGKEMGALVTQLYKQLSEGMKQNPAEPPENG